jgi:uncharacterized protein
MSWKEQVNLANLDEEIFPFWEGLKRHEFCLFRCKQCGAHYWPMAYCRNHPNNPPLDQMEWVPTSGRGSLYTWTIVHQVWNEAYADELPYTLALIELEEGPLFATRLADHDASQLRVGLPMEVQYEDVAATGLTLPLFRPQRGR